MQIALRPGDNMPTRFRRVIRDKKGKELETLVFEPDQPLELDADQIAAVAEDVGTVLVIVNSVLRNKESKNDPDLYRYLPDWSKTQRFGHKVAESLVSKAEKLGVKPDLKPFHVKCLEIGLKEIDRIAEADKKAADKKETEEPIEGIDEDDVEAILLNNQKEVADSFDVSVDVVKEWAKAGLRKNGNHYAADEVFAFITENKLIGTEVTEQHGILESGFRAFDQDGVLKVYAPLGCCIPSTEPLTADTLVAFIESIGDEDTAE